jgi:hypothetical protein
LRGYEVGLLVSHASKISRLVKSFLKGGGSNIKFKL